MLKTKRRELLLLLLSLSFIAAGLNHFYQPDTYLSIMPTYLPYPFELIMISGFFEVIGGLGILYGRSRHLAGVGLIALSIAVFPANLHMAFYPELYADIAPAWVWYCRLPLQILIIYWISYCCFAKTNRT